MGPKVQHQDQPLKAYKLLLGYDDHYRGGYGCTDGYTVSGVSVIGYNLNVLYQARCRQWDMNEDRFSTTSKVPHIGWEHESPGCGFHAFLSRRALKRFLKYGYSTTYYLAQPFFAEVELSGMILLGENKRVRASHQKIVKTVLFK